MSIILLFVILLTLKNILADQQSQKFPLNEQDQNVEKINSLNQMEESSMTFTVWTKYEPGFKSVTVDLNQKLPIRCRVSINGTELKEDDDLSDFQMTFYKDGKTLPNYWLNETAGNEDNVTINSKFYFEISHAQPQHRGLYSCRVIHNNVEKNFDFFVRVKEQRLTTWPLLIIAGQVLTLGLIFLLYELKLKNQSQDQPIKIKKSAHVTDIKNCELEIENQVGRGKEVTEF